MLKEIKKEKNVITNQDLFNEIIKKLKNLINGRPVLQTMNWKNVMKQDFIIMSLILYSLCSQAVMKDII